MNINELTESERIDKIRHLIIERSVELQNARKMREELMWMQNVKAPTIHDTIRKAELEDNIKRSKVRIQELDEIIKALKGSIL